MKEMRGGLTRLLRVLAKNKVFLEPIIKNQNEKKIAPIRFVSKLKMYFCGRIYMMSD
jgi:hypothetical protein